MVPKYHLQVQAPCRSSSGILAGNALDKAVPHTGIRQPFPGREFTKTVNSRHSRQPRLAGHVFPVYKSQQAMSSMIRRIPSTTLVLGIYLLIIVFAVVATIYSS